MKILICAGGTGGHIYPAVALGEKMIEKNEQNQLFYIGSNTRMEKEVIPSFGYSFIGMDIDNFKRGIVGKIISLYKMIRAYLMCLKVIKDKQIDVVIGFGNYISVPVVLAAKHMGVVTLIHEQNALPGKANLFLGKQVDAVVGSYPVNLDYFPIKKTYIYGNPRAQLAYQYKVSESFYHHYELNSSLKT
ncbi:MAG: glycosyltransferase, partial [Erysipelotrichaceae bacterium]